MALVFCYLLSLSKQDSLTILHSANTLLLLYQTQMHIIVYKTTNILQKNKITVAVTMVKKKKSIAKRETKAQTAIREDMKGVFLQNASIHKEMLHRKNKDKDGREGKWEEGQKKKKKKRQKRERIEGGSSGAALTILSPEHHLVHCGWELWRIKAFEGVERQFFLIKYSIGVAPLPTFNHWSLFPLIHKIKQI